MSGIVRVRGGVDARRRFSLALVFEDGYRDVSWFILIRPNQAALFFIDFILIWVTRLFLVCHRCAA